MYNLLFDPSAIQRLLLLSIQLFIPCTGALDALLTGNVAAAELLLEQKANVNLANDAGFTPLMAAARLGSGNWGRERR